MKSLFIGSRFWIGILLFAGPLLTEAGTSIKAIIDATDLPRGLITAEMTVPIESGQMDLYYPQWIEGVHGPTNPIQNLAGLEVTSSEGNAIPWKRHPRDIFRFQADAEGASSVTVKTTYICNQNGVGSTGIDSHGTSQLGIICWNTCLLYPVGESIYDVQIELTLRLPSGWSSASSLTAKIEEASQVTFERVSFQELMDSPLICGEHLRTYDITPKGAPTHTLALVSESKRALNIEDETKQKLTDLVEEAYLLFGGKHNYPYTFLLALSDHLPFIGLEHFRSSLNAVGENALEVDDEEASVTGQLLAHEYGHRWSGKYHRPAGMALDNYNTPKDTRLLWVYEGLDQYLGVVLAARSGLFATEEKTDFEGALTGSWMGLGPTSIRLLRQKGRRFMNLEDTAASSYIRRKSSPNWSSLRRSQDYYAEGGLLWFEIDAILRSETDGKITLDDFNKKFLGRYDAQKPIMPFEESDIINILTDLHQYDWKSLIDDRVRGFHAELSLKVLSRLGYRIEYSPKPTEFDNDASLTSLGMRVGSDGTLRTIIPGGIADKARLSDGDKIVGVNNKKFSANRLKDAIAESPIERRIEVLILRGELFDTVVLPYQEGPKYIDIVRNSNERDLLAEILMPKRKNSNENHVPSEGN